MGSWIFAFLISWSALAATSIPSPPTREIFIRLQTETVTLVEQINLSHIHGAKECACFLGFSQNRQTAPGCSRNDYSEEPKFIKQIVNYYGQSVSSQMSCEAVVDSLVLGPLKRQLSTMRQHMILMKADSEAYDDVSRTEFRSVPWFYQNQALPGNVSYLISQNLVHEISELPWSRKFPNSTPTAPTPSEMTEALNSYFESSKTKCIELLPKYFQKYGPGFSWILGESLDRFRNVDTEKLCGALYSSAETTEFGTKSSLARSFDILYRWVSAWRRKGYRESHRAEYVRMIQNNPLLVAFNTDSPPIEAVVYALAVMEKNAAQRLKSTSESLRVGGNLESVGMTPALVYTAARWRGLGYSEEDFSRIAAEASNELARSTRNWQLAKGAASVALITACALPWGKGVKAGLLLIRSSCLALAGLPLNTYFLYESTTAYDSAFRQFFSTLEGAKAIPAAINNQRSAVNSAMINAITLPIGIGLVEAKDAVAQLRNLFQ